VYPVGFVLLLFLFLSLFSLLQINYNHLESGGPTHNLQNSICNQSNPQNLHSSIATKATHNLHTSTATKLNHNLHNAKKLVPHKHETITNPNTPKSTTTVRTTTNMKQT
jgi:hypothetical protein